MSTMSEMLLTSLTPLLKWGARVNDVTMFAHNTALHLACEKVPKPEVAAMLLKFGADVNARNREGKTPFELLPNNPSSEAIARVLIWEAVKRESLGQSLCEGYQQMVQSCENYSKFDQESREEIMRMQSEKIDVEDSAISFYRLQEKKTEALTSELWTALILGQYDLANRLIYRGANINDSRKIDDDPVTTFVHYAAETGDVQGMRLLIKHGANCNACDSQGRTPLHWAVKTGDYPDVVEVLINEAAVVDARDVIQRTPLHLAVKNQFDESAQKLIARGASTEAVDIEGMTMLHTYFTRSGNYENLSMVKMLISRKVNIDAKNIDGCTALRLAVEVNSTFNMHVVSI